jgi:hypothetical protein
MVRDLAKCNQTTCEKYSTCTHGQSKCDVLYDFKHVCKDMSMYAERFEGMYRNTPEVKESTSEAKFEGNEGNQ